MAILLGQQRFLLDDWVWVMEKIEGSFFFFWMIWVYFGAVGFWGHCKRWDSKSNYQC